MSDFVIILTGAGISKESGIETFRDAQGLWANVRLEDVATAEALARDRPRVNAFYNARRRQLVEADIQPNAAHLALARLEEQWPADFLIVTQNVDDLHERAGTRNLIHMHGQLLEALCTRCSRASPWRTDVLPDSLCPACHQGGELRPNVVLFHETPYQMDAIEWALSRCGLFVSIGTSGAVYPAAGFAAVVRAQGGRTVELNLEPSQVANEFEEHLYGPATQVVPQFVDRLLAGLR